MISAIFSDQDCRHAVDFTECLSHPPASTTGDYFVGAAVAIVLGAIFLWIWWISLNNLFGLDKRSRSAKGYQREFSRIRPQVLRRDHRRCQHCGSPGYPGNPLHVHHIVYRRRGGTNSPSNLVTLCSACHKRHHRMWG